MKLLGRRIAERLRACGLLQAADFALLQFEKIRSAPSNAAFRRAHPQLAFPPASLSYDAYGHVCAHAYFDSGQRQASVFKDIVARCFPGSRDLSMLEWGCGAGRVLRHMRPLDGVGHISLHGTDYNPAAVAWCREHLGGVTVVQNDLKPPLAYAPGSFDCVYALSVFTHLSEELHYAWMEEIFRVLKPSGVFIFTTQGDGFMARMLPKEQRLYLAGNAVVRGRVREGRKHYNAYQPPAFVRKLLAGHEIVEHTSAHPDFRQDIWVARKMSVEKYAADILRGESSVPHRDELTAHSR